MKKIIDDRYANLYLNAAVRLGLGYKILNKNAALVEIFHMDKTLRLSSNVLSLNSQLSSSLSTNKKRTSLLLQEEGIPVPKFTTFTSFTKATKYALKKLEKQQPIVTKPLSGSLSIGITVNPSTPAQVKRAIKEALSGRNEIIIEEYIEGSHYRITTLDNEVIAVTLRTPAYVVADGKKCVSQLVKEKNGLRAKRNLPPINFRRKDHDYQKMKNICLTDVYPKGDVKILQLGCDLDIGGERKRIALEKIPKTNKRLFIQAAKTLGLRFAGIDYISPDITIPHTKTRTAINEINSAPDSDVHFRDSYPHDNYAAERVLEMYFLSDSPDDEILQAPSFPSSFTENTTIPLINSSKNQEWN